MTILDLIIKQESSLKTALSQHMALEALLLRILRERHRVPIEYIAKRLSELEKQFGLPQAMPEPPKKAAVKEPEPIAIPDPRLEILPSLEKKIEKASLPVAAAPVLSAQEELQKKNRYDTLVQLAAVELDATVQKAKLT